MNTIYARQGDLMFFTTSDPVKKKEGVTELTIELGETTGHAHRMIAEVGAQIRGSRTHFTLTGKARLVHDEHDVIPFEAGTYVMLRKSERDPIEQTLRQVQD